ncbi:MAG: kelch repeat-containing protein, partial [Myxococcota bacterium]|nr:kelch repeat-containing protein [Myxococcota bacterium]
MHPELDDKDFMWPGTVDQDRDGVGHRCDNCPTVWNADQTNCNENEERSRQAARWPGWDGALEFRGTGDACDATPCLAECAKLSGQQTETIRTTRDECVLAGVGCMLSPEGHTVCDYDCTTGEPADLAVCPVGFPDPAAALDHDFPAHVLDTEFDRLGSPANQALRLTTDFRGCSCRPEEGPLAEGGDGSCGDRRCPNRGVNGLPTRWSYATNDHQHRYCAAGTYCDPDPPQPVWNYRRTYAKDLGERATTASPPYEPSVGAYRDWYLFGGPRDAAPGTSVIARDEWNFLTDAEQWLWEPTEIENCRTVDGELDCRIFPRDVARDVFVWFKPRPSTGYGGFVHDFFGNSYIERRDVCGDHHREKTGEVGIYQPLPGPGESYLSISDGRLANIVGAYSPFVGLLDPFISTDPKYMFKQPGTIAGGLLTAKWDGNSQLYTDLVGTKLTAGNYDVESSSVATVVLADGKMTAYYLFGGRNAAGLADSGFWMGRRESTEGPDGQPQDMFFLYQIEGAANADWPTARWGANLTLGAADVGKPAQIGSDASWMFDFGSAVADGGGTQTVPSSLVLVGGENETGLLADIWIFDGAWRHAGDLPGVEDGLSEAGAAVVGNDLWLFGGRRESGPSADLWRIDLGTGIASAVAVAGEVRPAARVRPSLAVDPTTGELLIFGGTGEGTAFNDLWAFSMAESTWRLVAGECCEAGCPATTGHERLVPSGIAGNVTVLADPYGPAADKSSWDFADGSWASRSEARGLPGRDDCDLDGVRETGWGARCDPAGEGFPSYGRLRCDTTIGYLACRPPAAPGQALVEYILPGEGPVVPVWGGIGVLQGRSLDVYDLGPGGSLTPRVAVRLSRPGHDVVVDGDFAFVGDRDGLTIYSIGEAAEVASVPT